MGRRSVGGRGYGGGLSRLLERRKDVIRCVLIHGKSLITFYRVAAARGLTKINAKGITGAIP